MEALHRMLEFITGDQKIYWAFAIIGSTIFIIQTILIIESFYPILGITRKRINILIHNYYT